MIKRLNITKLIISTLYYSNNVNKLIIINNRNNKFISNNNKILQNNEQNRITNQINRFYSTTNSKTQQQQDINKINKIALKKFFLKVHPDLFFQFPNIKKTNDKSLRELHGFLEEIKTERLTRKQYDMKFYYLDNNIYDQESDIPSMNIQFSINISWKSTPDSFERVSQHLQDAQDQIQSFFKLIGIKEQFILHSMIGNKLSTGNGGQNETNLNNDSLLSFLKNLSKYAQDININYVEQERQVDLMYTYFYMEHKIRVLFQDHELPLDQRKSFLIKLEKLLSKLTADDRGTNSSNEQLINQIFNNGNEQKKKKSKKKLDSFSYYNQEEQDELQDQQGTRFKGFGERLRNSSMETKQEITEPFTMFSGSNKQQFSGWQHIKSGYITPESNPKNDESSISDRLEGVSVVFSNSLPNGIDKEGRLILNQSSTQISWTKLLKSFKPSEIIENIKQCKKRQEIEKEIAKFLGVAFIFTDYSLQNEQIYLDLLKKLHSIGNFKNQKENEQQYQQDQIDKSILERVDNGIFSKDDFINNNNGCGGGGSSIKGLEEISIKVIINQSNTTGKKSSKSSSSTTTTAAEPWKFDSKLGVLHVPCQVEFIDIIQFLKTNQESIKNEFQRHKINMRNMAQLELTVKRTFRLSRLKKLDDSISLNEMVSCLRRLLCNHQFSPYLCGMKLIIGRDENKVNSDGTVQIKWDFEV